MAGFMAWLWQCVHTLSLMTLTSAVCLALLHFSLTQTGEHLCLSPVAGVFGMTILIQYRAGTISSYACMWFRTLESQLSVAY